MVVVLVAIAGTFLLVAAQADRLAAKKTAKKPIKHAHHLVTKKPVVKKPVKKPVVKQPATAQAASLQPLQITAFPSSTFDFNDTTSTDKVNNRSSSSQRINYHIAIAPGVSRVQADNAVNVALSQLGTAERPSNSNCVANNRYHNVVPGYGCAPWCAYFLSWVWQKAGVNIPTLGYTGYIHDWGVSHGLWHAAGSSYTPRPGDAVLFSGYVHTSMVIAENDGKITLIAGNWNNKVQVQRSDNNLNSDYPANFTADESNGVKYHIYGYVSPQI